MNEKELLENGYKKYRRKEIDVFFNKEMCIHSARCVNGNPDVFNTQRRPWVLPDHAKASSVAETINTCPSGALKYIYNGDSEALPKKPAED